MWSFKGWKHPGREAGGLSAEDEMIYVKAWQEQGSVRARDALLRAHMPMINWIAKKLARVSPHVDDRNHSATSSVSIEDLEQVGCLAFCYALDRYDHRLVVETGKPLRLSTYTRSQIRGDMTRLINSQRTATTAASESDRALVARASRDLYRRHGRPPTNDEVAKQLRWPSVDRVRAALRRAEIRLDAPISTDADGGDITMRDLLRDPGPLPDQIAAETIDVERTRMLVREALMALSDRERQAVVERYLLGNGVSAAANMGLSRPGVDLIVNRALRRMRRRLQRRGREATTEETAEMETA